MYFEYIAEFSLAVASYSRSLLLRAVFDQSHGCVNRLPVFSWRFLLHEHLKNLPNPIGLLINMIKDRFGVH